jgi:hypothetical protein
VGVVGRFAASGAGLGLGRTVGSTSIPFPRHSFGIKADVKDNIWYIDEMQVVFPVGNNIVLHNVEQKVQRFIAGAFSEIHRPCEGCRRLPPHAPFPCAARLTLLVCVVWWQQAVPRRRMASLAWPSLRPSSM